MEQTGWEKTLEILFENLGLSQKEAHVYRVLLDLGTAKASTVVSRSGLKRGITYATLYNLEKIGLISSFKKDGKTYFQAANPQKLLDIVDKYEKKIKQVREGLAVALPKLVSQYKLAIGKPTIRYFEGEEGIRTVFADIYAPKEGIVWGCVDLEKADTVFPQHIQNELIPLRVKNKVVAHSFIADSSVAREVAKKDKKQFRWSIILDKEKYPLPAEIDVYEDKIAMLSFDKGEFIGLLIENKDFARSLRSIFAFAFHKSKR